LLVVYRFLEDNGFAVFGLSNIVLTWNALIGALFAAPQARIAKSVT